MFILLACEKIYVYVKGGRNFLSLYFIFKTYIFQIFLISSYYWRFFFLWQFGSFNNNKNKYLKYFKKKKNKKNKQSEIEKKFCLLTL